MDLPPKGLIVLILLLSLVLMHSYIYVQCKQTFFIFRCREKAREKMMDLVQIMDSDTKKTAKVAKLKEWFVAREAQMAQLSLDGKLFLH